MDPLKKKVQGALNNFHNQIANNIVVKVGQSPVGHALVNTQSFLEGNKPIQIPQLNKSASNIKIGSVPIVNKPVTLGQAWDLGRSFVNPALNLGYGTATDIGTNIGKTISGQPLKQYKDLKSPFVKAGYQISNIAQPNNAAGYNVNMKPQEVLGNAGAIGEGLFSVYGGGRVLGLGKGVPAMAEKTLAQNVFRGAKMGGIIGGGYGVSSGLNQGRNETLPKQLLQAIESGAFGAGGGAVLGGGTSVLGSVFSKVGAAIQKQNPKMTPKEVNKATIVYMRDRLGKFTGVEDIKNTFIPAGGNGQPKSLKNGTIKITKGGETVGWMDRVDNELNVDPEARASLGLTVGKPTNKQKAQIAQAGLSDVFKNAEDLAQNYTRSDLEKKIGMGVLRYDDRGYWLVGDKFPGTKMSKAEMFKRYQQGVAQQPLSDTSAELQRGKQIIEDAKTALQVRTPQLPQQQVERGLSSSMPQYQTSKNAGLVQKLEQSQIPPLGQEAGSRGSQALGKPNVKDSLDHIISYSYNKADKLYTEALDRFHPLSKLAKTAGEDQAMRNALTGYYGAGSMAKYKVDYELAPILRSVDTNSLRKAAIALRDAELQSRGIKGSNTGALDDLLKDKIGGADPKMGEALKALYKYQDNLVKENLVDTGIMSKEAYQAMKAKNQFYVPFQRVMDNVDEWLGGVPQSRGAGSVGSQNVIKGIKGSEREIKDPLESIIANTYKTVGLGQRQKVAKTIVSLQDKLPEGMIKEIKGDVGNKSNIALFVNGKVKHYSVPPEVADAAKGMSEEQLNTIVKILSGPTRVFRATATGVNPEFAIPNVARDLQSAFLNAGVNPLKWTSGLAHMIRKDQVYQDFLKAGGMTERISLDQPYLKQSLEQITNKSGISIKKPSDIYELLKAAGAYSEQPTRIAAFQKSYGDAIKQGLSHEEAMSRGAYTAQDATVNFARRGSKTQSINAIYAFLNARAQGIDRLARTVKNDPKGAAVRLGMITVAPALGLYAYNRNFKSYNDPRVVSQNDKNNNFIIMLSDQPVDKLGGAQFIKIPKGEIGSLANPIEAFLSYIDGNKTDGGQAISSALQAFSPISDIGGVIPTAIRPIVEQAANKNFFFGNNIVPDYKKNYPAGAQDTSSTAPIFRMIGQKTNISPARLQAGVEGYGTGIAKIGEMALNPLVPQQYRSAKNDQGAGINKTPILRRVLGGEKKTVEEQNASLQSQAKSIDFQINDIKSGVKRGDITYEQGMNQINQLQTKQADLLKQSGGSRQVKDNVITYQGTSGGIKTLDLNSPASGTGIGAFASSDWQAKKAASIWNDPNIPQDIKDQALKTLKVDPQDARYAALAAHDADVSTQYIISKSPDHQTLLNNLLTGRVVSNTGSQFASNEVINKLNEQGYLSDSEAKALKKIKIAKDGTNLSKSSGAKKLSVAKIGSKRAPSFKIKKQPKLKFKKVAKSKKVAQLRVKTYKVPKKPKLA